MIKAAESRKGNLCLMISECMPDKGLWLHRKCFLHVDYLLCTMQCDFILTSQNEMLEVGGLFLNISER